MDENEMLETDVTEDVIEDVGEGGGEEDIVTDADNPWAWADGLDPEKIAKTWNGYTQNQQALAKEREELTPIMELRDEILADEKLQAHLRNYYEGKADAPELELGALRSELTSLKTDMMVEREIGSLTKFVKDEGLPAFDKEELVKYAAKGNYPSLEDAYKSLKFDEIRQSVEEGTYNKIKQTKGNAIPKVGAADKRTTGGAALQDLLSGSDEDFIKNYDEILRKASRG
jgi:hypothetical protein